MRRLKCPWGLPPSLFSFVFIGPSVAFISVFVSARLKSVFFFCIALLQVVVVPPTFLQQGSFMYPSAGGIIYFSGVFHCPYFVPLIYLRVICPLGLTSLLQLGTLTAVPLRLFQANFTVFSYSLTCLLYLGTFTFISFFQSPSRG